MTHLALALTFINKPTVLGGGSAPPTLFSPNLLRFQIGNGTLYMLNKFK